MSGPSADVGLDPLDVASLPAGGAEHLGGAVEPPDPGCRPTFGQETRDVARTATQVADDGRRFEANPEQQNAGRIGQMQGLDAEVKRTMDLVVSGREDWQDVDQVFFRLVPADWTARAKSGQHRADRSRQVIAVIHFRDQGQLVSLVGHDYPTG